MLSFLKTLLVVGAVFVLATALAEKFMTKIEIVNGVAYATQKPQNQVYVFSIALTVIIIFIYQKLAEKFNL